MTKILENFWVFEGLDGAGTTTQQKILIDRLEKTGIKCFKTQEPTDFETGKFLRQVLSGKIKAKQSTISYLFAADRDNHINNSEDGVISHLKKGETVISDRYLFSSLAYQSIGFPYGKVAKINSDFPLPEIIFYIDTSVENCIGRIDSRGNKKEIYEKSEFQKLVQAGYEKCFAKLPQGCTLLRINGNKEVDSVAAELFRKLKALKKIKAIRF